MPFAKCMIPNVCSEGYILSTRERSKIRIEDHRATSSEDEVAAEEPLEIRVQGVSLAVVMRTPGDDEDLAAGFLCTEGIVESHARVKRIEHCDVAAEPDAVDNVIQVRLQEDIQLDLEVFRRNTYASSSCGICGKATLENIKLRVEANDSELYLSPDVIYGLPAALEGKQQAFLRSGGLHAAALYDVTGNLCVLREDVGRHNAVDKVVGAELRRYGCVRSPILLVSGRISFEVVQKAALAGIALLAGISAPTSLAVDLANALNITLVGFLRGRKMNVYAAPHRIGPIENVSE